jgi:cell wall-associated NlpC family hydrolase
MSLTAEQRAEIVRAAKEWLRTPYHHRAFVKGVGADCAMFPLAIYKQCGLIPTEYQPPEYAMQWHLHRSEELYLKELEKFCSQVNGPPQPGDFVVFRFGRTFSHGAIVVNWPLIVHSCIPHGVVLSDALRDGELAGRERKVFAVAPGSQMRHLAESEPGGEAEHGPGRAGPGAEQALA